MKASSLQTCILGCSKSGVGMAVGEACWLEKEKRGNERGKSERLLTCVLGSHRKVMCWCPVFRQIEVDCRFDCVLALPPPISFSDAISN